MADKKMKKAYRIAQELLRDRLRQTSPDTVELLDEIHEADVIVVRGQYDHIEDVFDVASTPYTLIDPGRLGMAQLRPDQIVFINCPGHLTPPGLRKLTSFVHQGGFLFTTDWALKHVLQPAFPGFVEYNRKPTRDEVVRIEIIDQQESMLDSVLDERDDPLWWLESSSYPIRILDSENVKVLIRSNEIEERHGEAPVFISFDYGKGRIYHMISHFYLQRSETRTARQAKPSTEYVIAKGVEPADMPKYVDMGTDELTTGQLESALSSNTMILGVLLRKKQHDRRRREGGKRG